MNESNFYDYQRTATDHVLDNTHCALFLEMGLGKTVVSLTAIKKLMFEELDIASTLVVAPKRVVESVWEAECEKWDHLKGLKLVKVIGTERQRKKALTEKADIHLISRDNIAWLCGQYGGKMLPFDMLVIDELSSFKSPKSLRFKTLRKVQPSFKRVVGLTGTPAPNGLIDLWSQIYLLDRGERLGRFISTYRDDYFKPGQRNGDIIYSYQLRTNAEALIHDRIKDICISMKKEDYLTLPKTIDNPIKIQFPPNIQAKYDAFEKEQVLELFPEYEEGQVISAVNAAALNVKLLQFANGAIYDENRDYHVVHDLKIDAIKEIIEDANGKPILIAWTFRHDMYRLTEALKKYNPRELKTDQDIKDWNAGKIQVLMMHPASGGHGLNLQFGGHIVVWFGQTWSLELLEQLNARLHRPGQDQPVIINKLVASKTIDEDVIKSQESKDKTQRGLMEAVKARIKKYLV